MLTFDLYPGNDLSVEFPLTQPHPTRDGQTAPLTTGEADAFLCTQSDIDLEAAVTPFPAEAADSTLVAIAAHIAHGVWRVTFESTVLTPELCKTLFEADAPCVVLEHEDGRRVWMAGTYHANRAVS